ncbi:MAG: bifunctional 4-hydroxy-2-oxoglutarate aldolase/2-dehydro-3-deoxy-phosphogluconate aldolase [Chloroflexota bacterium]|jgi:2-dehydro-3-deoxyphosphogluconate aldolase/(4S)-4-hydroxy-2-oxoglutarate aldolase|nr:bifunctional 4-hydroxy-2-oxoglutarate aldolase/2-dehydro-3-deoxy-phosphogluconate aldolase [Chloroflexota bacterium]
MSESTLHTIHRGKVVAIVRLPDLADAIELSRALISGGITALEFTLTNSEALNALQAVKAAIPEFGRGEAVIGAGTVVTPDQVRASVAAGAQFIVAPTSNFAAIATSREMGVPIMPGAYTPTEILAAWEAGAAVVKVFPARALGPNFIKDVREPLPFLKLMPTGGIGIDNIAAYLQAGAFGVGVGGNLVDKQMVAARDWAGLYAKAQAFIKATQ